jgi:hypothetical protein
MRMLDDGGRRTSMSLRAMDHDLSIDDVAAVDASPHHVFAQIDIRQDVVPV